MAVAPPSTRHLNLAVLADVHLGTTMSKANEVLEYLESITPDTLVLAGDFISLEAVKKSKLPQKHLAVVRRILDLAHAGSKVYYLTGNHDARLRKLGNLALGNLHIRQELQLQFDGHKYYFFHGDSLDAAVKYKLSSNLINGFWRKLIDLSDSVVVNVRKLFGRQKWSLASEVKANPAKAEGYVKLFEQAASKLADSKGCDHVICAHIHQPKIELKNLRGKVVYYLNAGDWVENLTALEYRFGKWKLYVHDPDDYPKVGKRLRTPLVKSSKRAIPIEQELLRKLVDS